MSFPLAAERSWAVWGSGWQISLPHTFIKNVRLFFIFFITSDIIIHYLQIHVKDILIRLSIFHLFHKPTIMRHFFRYEFKLF